MRGSGGWRRPSPATNASGRPRSTLFRTWGGAGSPSEPGGDHCPYVQAWDDRLNAIARDYADRNVRVVAVNSNDAERYPEDSFEEMRKRAAAHGFAFDYLYDDPQAVAQQLGSERTPEVFLYDRDRRLVYHGAIDDSRDERAVSQHYLRDALDAVLGGEEPAVTETPPVGCTLKWK